MENGSEYFRYAPLKNPQTEFRLLHLLPRYESIWQYLLSFFWAPKTFPISCRLENVSLKACPKYAALSYTWGELSKRSQITVNGRLLSITENLNAALHQLRQDTKPLTLWIDAICINQLNIEEKNEQVKRMTGIYRDASDVLVWLGPAADESDKVIECLQAIGAEYAKQGLTDQFPAAQYKAFCSRPWWSRAWVVQELSVARQPIFICGKCRISFEHLRDSASFLLTYGWHRLQKIPLHDHPEDPQIKKDYDWTHESLLTSFASDVMFSFRQQYQKPQASRECTLYSLLRITCAIANEELRIKATDERDKIFALLGLASDQDALKIGVDYAKKPEDVYIDTSRALLVNGHLQLLSLRGDNSVVRNLPSWVRDWSESVQWPYGDPTLLDKPFAASGTSLPQVKVDLKKKTARIQGFVVDEIEALGAPVPKPNSETPGTDWNAVDIFISETQRLCNSVVGGDFTDEDIACILLGGLEYDGAGHSNSLTVQHRRVTTKSHEGYKLTKKWLKIFRDLEYLNAKKALQEMLTQDDMMRMESVTVGMREVHGEPMTSISTFSVGMNDSLERIPFRSKMGFAGLVPQKAEKEDATVVFAGSALPCVLRRLEGGGWKLVGEAYVHQIMDGELMETGVSFKEFELF